MRYLLILLAMTAIPTAVQAESCSLLDGKATDYTVIRETPTGVLLRNRTGAAVSSSYACFRFKEDKWDIRSLRFVPRFSTESGDPAAEYKKGYAEALEQAIQAVESLRP